MIGSSAEYRRAHPEEAVWAIRPRLDRLPTDVLRATRILVLAHTDSFAADSYNATMSSRRGQAVADYLRARGIAAGRIATHGCAGREPIASNETTRGRLDNRRIELAITADDDWRRSARLPPKEIAVGNGGIVRDSPAPGRRRYRS